MKTKDLSKQLHDFSGKASIRGFLESFLKSQTFSIPQGTNKTTVEKKKKKRKEYGTMTYRRPSTTVRYRVKVGISQTCIQGAKGNSEGAGVLHISGGEAVQRTTTAQTPTKLGIMEEWQEKKAII